MFRSATLVGNQLCVLFGTLTVAMGVLRASATNSTHWAFQPLTRPTVPASKHANAIDAFVSSTLTQSRLKFSPEAERRTLIRRLSFDLRGLPPSPEEVAEFLKDTRNGAFERLVEKFLAPPQYGERWGRHWLDIVGYADSNGYFSADSDRPLAWKFRDYVVRSLNADKPLDQFIQQQIAGDELVGYLAGGDVTSNIVDSLIATHFWRNAPDGTGESDGNPLEVKVDKYAVIEGNVQILGLRYLGDDRGLGGGVAPEVSFNYLGQAGHIEAPAPWLRMAGETVQGDFSPFGRRPHLIDVNAIFLNGRLQFDWIFNPALHHEATIQQWSASVEQTLRAIVEHCRNTGDLLPVTSMQEQILKHSVAHPDSLAYRVELACDLAGTLDRDRFAACWQRAIDRHPALRAEFTQLADGTFRQRFAPALQLSWDGSEGPVLGGPLVSALLEPIGGDRIRFTLRHHHVLIDGWSVSKVMGEVLAEYHGERGEGDALSVEPYLQWLAQRDPGPDLAFWASELAGVNTAPNTAVVEGPHASEAIPLGTALSADLRAYAVANRLTLNTVLFGAWAITLASIRNVNDITIGTVFSGRNAPVDGADDMVGMLINTLPLRVVIADDQPLGTWLSDLQRRLALAMEHSAAPLSAIESRAGLTGGAFASTFRFQNYPVDPGMLQGGSRLRVEAVAIRDVWHHPLNISVIPGDDIQVIADYFPSVHGSDAVALTLAVFSGVVAQLLDATAEPPASLLDPQFGGVLD